MMQQRQCIMLEGDADWCRTSSQLLLEEFNPANIIALSSDGDNRFLTIAQKQAQQYLGKEFDAVIFDGLAEFNADSLGAIIGTIRQGGVLIVWLNTSQNSLWLQRFKNEINTFVTQYDQFEIIQQWNQWGNQWGQTRLISGKNIENAACDLKSIESAPVDFDPIDFLTDNQKQAVEAIKKVVYGHRRRPLVLSADRGRGKSAALGIAAAQLLSEGKQNIVITAPSLAIAETVFKHAFQLLDKAECSPSLISFNNAEIRFISPDALLELDLKADLVMVDEAAAIPASMLEKLLQRYSRLVFSTTLHGYEGTGRGFAVRFQKILDNKTPDWCNCQMHTPIRWAEDDLLEKFSFQSLLLNATPVADELIADAQVEQCQIEIVDRQILITDEKSLRELFGLMVLAHYRTRPSDLQMLLDRDDMTVYVMRYQGHIIASAWLVDEGELDPELSLAVYEGKRRLKGHLLPQSLLAHSAANEAGELRYQRIVRIAVHPAIQKRKMGQTLLTYCIKHAQQNGYDVVGTSFAMDENLLNFWSKSAFEFVRLGIHRDDVSGHHAVMMLKALSAKGLKLVSAVKQRYQQQWPYLLKSQFNCLAVEQLVSLSQLLEPQQTTLLIEDKQEIAAFAYGQRSYEASQVVLWQWLSQVISRPEFLQLNLQQQSVCVQSVLQQQPWAELLKQTEFAGKKQAITALRQAIALTLEQMA